MIKKLYTLLVHRYIRYKGRPAKLKQAVKDAQEKHKKDGKRYRVFFFGYKYYAWNREDIKRRKRSGLFYDFLKVGKDFDSICHYDTENPESYVIPK